MSGHDMIDKIARAIMEARENGGCEVKDWRAEARDNPHVAQAVAQAIAAVRALREPTWPMCSAGGMRHAEMVATGHADSNDPDCRYIFEAMIDSILSTQQGGE